MRVHAHVYGLMEFDVSAASVRSMIFIFPGRFLEFVKLMCWELQLLGFL